MHIIGKRFFLVFIISCSWIAGVSGQIIPDSAYGVGSHEHHEIQKLINGSISHAENMLAKQGAYLPYAAALTALDSIVIIDGYANTKNKTLKLELDDLKKILKAGADKGQYKAIVVYHDATVTDPNTKLPLDAIAAFTEQINTSGTYTFYFPYKKAKERITYSAGVPGEITDSEIFTKVGE